VRLKFLAIIRLIRKEMSFFRKIFAPKPKQKREFLNVKRGEDPFVHWEKIGELGDGAFGKVYKVCILNYLYNNTPTPKEIICVATGYHVTLMYVG